MVLIMVCISLDLSLIFSMATDICCIFSLQPRMLLPTAPDISLAFCAPMAVFWMPSETSLIRSDSIFTASVCWEEPRDRFCAPSATYLAPSAISLAAASIWPMVLLRNLAICSMDALILENSPVYSWERETERSPWEISWSF